MGDPVVSKILGGRIVSGGVIFFCYLLEVLYFSSSKLVDLWDHATRVIAVGPGPSLAGTYDQSLEFLMFLSSEAG